MSMSEFDFNEYRFKRVEGPIVQHAFVYYYRKDRKETSFFKTAPPTTTTIESFLLDMYAIRLIGIIRSFRPKAGIQVAYLTVVHSKRLRFFDLIRKHGSVCYTVTRYCKKHYIDSGPRTGD